MNVNINVPEELYEQARIIAEAHRIPVDQVFASAFAEHIATWQRLRERAARGNREKFLAVLDEVPDVEPEEHDRL
ncbi:MAG: toxin-antitoxin system HicB family antitoxin [Terriglobia bacterium]